MSEWEPEIEVDEELARTLIAEQFPALDLVSLRRLGEGWDNTLWVTGAGIAFRFPRREIAIPGVRREISILPKLALRLPAPIPNAAYVGAPSDRFPWPWFGSPLIDGSELSAVHLDGGQRERLAGDLGGFLRCLHSLELPEAEGLVVDPMGRGDMSRRVPRHPRGRPAPVREPLRPRPAPRVQGGLRSDQRRRAGQSPRARAVSGRDSGRLRA